MKSIKELWDETDLPMLMVDRLGLITAINSPFEASFGWHADEIVGRELTIIIPAEYHDAHNMGFARFLKTGQSELAGQPLELPAVDKNGRVFAAEHTIFAEKRGEEWLLAATIRPLIL